MSDDLISLKALLNEVEYDDKYRLIIPYEKIKNAQTAFDREKVISKLKGQYENARKMRYSGNNQFYEYWVGRMDSYRDAIKIVEKAELVPDQADAGKKF